MEIINLTPEKASFINNVFVYGTIKRGADTKLKILIKDDGILEQVGITRVCGCTEVLANKTDEGILVEIEYNSNLIGYFDKKIVETYKTNGEQKIVELKINGTVVQ